VLTSALVKKQARVLGADLVGIASMDRFEGTPRQQDPRYIFPGAKALIALAFRIPRGYLRGIEEGTFFGIYANMGSGGMTMVYMPIVMRELACYIEEHDYEAVPVSTAFGNPSITWEGFDPTISRPVSPDKPHPDVTVDCRLAAFAAGLGEIGYSGRLLTPEFGPRQRIGIMLTDAPLEPDPLFEGELCDRCMLCATECPGNAISAIETQTATVAGRKLEWGKLDVIKCSIARRGGNPAYNPFMRPGTEPSRYEQLYEGGAYLDQMVGYPRQLEQRAAIGGALGCIRACMIHLEEKGALKNSFVNPFRRRSPWKLGPEDPFKDSDAVNQSSEPKEDVSL